MSKETKILEKLVKLLSLKTGEEWSLATASNYASPVITEGNITLHTKFRWKRNQEVLDIHHNEFPIVKGCPNWDKVVETCVEAAKKLKTMKTEAETANKRYANNKEKIEFQASKFSAVKIIKSTNMYDNGRRTAIELIPSSTKEDNYLLKVWYGEDHLTSREVISTLERLASSGLIKRASDQAAMVARMTQTSPLDVQAEWDKEPQAGEILQLSNSLDTNTISVSLAY